MKTIPASRPRNAPLSEVWWPESGSTICAMVAPILVSMICPAASSAQSTEPKKKPMTSPTNTSLANIAPHWPGPSIETSSVGCSESETMPSETRIELRTIAGIRSGEKIGISMKATAIRAVATPSRSIGSLHPVTAGSSPGIR